MSVDFQGLVLLAEDRKIPIEQLINYIENRVAEAYAEFPECKPKGRCVYNRLTGEFVIHVPVYDEEGIWLETVIDNPEGFEAVAESIARKSLKERMREERDNAVIEEFAASIGDIISGEVQQGRDETVVYVYLGGRTEGKIPLNEQVKGEVFKHGDRIKAFVVKVEKGERGPEITLSRTHPQLVRALFALEVPEINDRVVEVMGVSREPGQRTKISVRTHRAGVSPKGALIGPSGARSRAVSDELFGEKIDIVDWSDDPATYVANALAPARVTSAISVNNDPNSIKVIVPDFQLSLAIGKDGQNARLAARLTGCRIDIHPDNPVQRIEKPKPIIEAEAVETESDHAHEEAKLPTEA
ncbi:MAG: transcription termination factor NusA [Actinomycetes bacterium]